MVRGILALLAMGGLALTVWLGFEAVRLRTALNAAHTARTTQLMVDLSRPGSYAGVVHQTYRAAHAHVLMLECTPPTANQAQAERMIDGLGFRIELDVPVTTTQPAVLRPLIRSHGDAGKAEIELARLDSLSLGEHPFTLHIVEPAKGLAGRQQVLVGRYEFCGLEEMSAGLTRWLAIGAGIITALLGLISLRLTPSRTIATQSTEATGK